jgi:hypothetical protein
VEVSTSSPILLGNMATTSASRLVMIVGSDTSGVDFGFAGSASMGDTIFYDSNGDGSQNFGETGIHGVRVTLTLPNGEMLATATDTSGNYHLRWARCGVTRDQRRRHRDLRCDAHR